MGWECGLEKGKFLQRIKYIVDGIINGVSLFFVFSFVTLSLCTLQIGQWLGVLSSFILLVFKL